MVFDSLQIHRKQVFLDELRLGFCLSVVSSNQYRKVRGLSRGCFLGARVLAANMAKTVEFRSRSSSEATMTQMSPWNDLIKPI